MLKIEIEGIEVHYKNVSDLHERIQAHLDEVHAKRTKAAGELKALTRREKALRKFLGIQKPPLPTPMNAATATQTRAEK